MIEQPTNYVLNDQEKNISIEQGFTICLNFFSSLWPSMEPKLQDMGHEESIINELFFLDVCMGFECSAQWNEAVFRITKVSKQDQRKGLKLTEKETFLCAFEFCRIYDKIFKFQLSYILNLVQSMLDHPSQHALEWGLWKKWVDSSFKSSFYFDINWNDGPYSLD